MSFIEIEYRERDKSWDMSALQCHDYYEIYFLLDGERNFFYNDREFRLTGRSMCVIPPFAMHKTSGAAYRRININVSDDLLLPSERELLARLSEDTVFSLDGEGYDGIVNMLCEASDVIPAAAGERVEITLSFARAILYLISKVRPSPIAKSRETASIGTDALVTSAVAYINLAYREQISLDAMSRRFYVSKNTLCARFRAAMNCSLMQYLSFVRLKRAKELLKTTDKSVSEIAALCGYSSSNYFSLIFKRSVGIAPQKYRKSE